MTLHSRISEFVRYHYKTDVRPRLPRRLTEYNGVAVRASRLFDSVVPFQTGYPDRSAYESALVDGLRERVQPGDDVVVVGGGWGVTAVVAAVQAGPDGHVDVYEGSSEYVDRIHETLKLNGVSDRVSVHHAIVAEEIQLRGSSDGASTLQPSELPPCDLLELDCEGAERKILQAFEERETRPRTILVETHGNLGAPSDEVTDRLDSLGYQLVGREPAESAMLDLCLENDVYVLTATRA